MAADVGDGAGSAPAGAAQEDAAGEWRAQRLRELRDAIDQADARLVELLNERMRHVVEVGRLKNGTGAPIYQPDREAQVLQRVARANRAHGGPLPDAAVTAIFREVMSAGRALQRPLRVAYLGPEGTFCELAMLKQFGSGVQAHPCGSIDEAFHAAESGETDYAVVPVENSTEGGVSRSLDLLVSTPLSIIAEVSVPVQLHLLARTAEIGAVRRIYGIPIAMAQCLAWLDRHVPGIERVPVASNGEAARRASEDPGAAAVAGEQAAARYGLQTVAAFIQDEAGNRTRFVVLARQAGTLPPPAGAAEEIPYKTSLILSVANRAGAVHEMLSPLARHGVSMTRLESRPARTSAWEYLFFVDIEGHANQAPVAAALDDLRRTCAFFRCLGSYPRAE